VLGVLARNPRFRRLWLAQVVSQAGDWLTRMALLALIGELGGARAQLGLGVLYGIDLVLHMLPAAAFSPLAGPLADRLPRRALMVASDVARALVVLGFLAVDEPDELPLLYGLTLAQMSIGIFFDSARSGALPSTVRTEDLYDAYVLSAATWSVMLAVGACAGGLALGWLGPVGVFVLDSASYVVSALCLWGLRLPPVPVHERPFSVRDVLTLAEMRRTLAYVRSLGLLPAVAAKVFWGVGGGYLVLLSVAGVVRFGERGPSGAGAAVGGGAAAGGPDGGELDEAALARTGLAVALLYCARGVGTGLGPMIARAWRGSSDAALRQHIALGFFAAALGYSLFGFARHLAPAFLAVALAHTGGSALWVASTTLWQRRVDDAWRGRVHALDFFGMTVAFSVTGVAVGWLYDRLGSLEHALWIHSAATVAAGLTWTAWSRRTPASGAPAGAGESAGESAGAGVG
jgi:MFS family permease